MIIGNGSPWYNDRDKCFNWYLNQLRVGDSLFSQDYTWEIVYLFVNSKMPQYIVYHNGNKVFPLTKVATPKRKDLVQFLLSQDPNSETDYLSHLGLNFVENGSIRLMTDISDLLPQTPDQDNNSNIDPNTDYIDLMS